jgi:hypothetical protein
VSDDSTFGGYLRQHDRPPAFAGSDGRSYSVEVLVDDSPDADGRFGGSALFVQWSEAGDRPTGHVESPTVAREPEPAAARDAVLALSLYRLKELLDAAIAAEAERPDW